MVSIQELKRSFRSEMNGVAAAAMRDAGLGYKLCWGISLPVLRRMADETGQSYPLAIALWQEQVRECRIMAPMVMPPDEATDADADLWAHTAGNPELASIAATTLFCRMDHAPQLAFSWIADPDWLVQTAGWHTLARLFAAGQEPNQRATDELLDHMATALADPHLPLRKAALAAAQRLSEMALHFQRRIDTMLSSITTEGTNPQKQE